MSRTAAELEVASTVLLEMAEAAVLPRRIELSKALAKSSP
jgi:hypothetical protein